MAKITSLLTGILRGKAGAFNFRYSKGQNIASAYQPEPRNPKTPAQMFQRKKIELIQAFYRLKASIFKLGYRQTANPLSPVNAFMSDNMKNAITGTSADDAAINWPNVQTAKGTMGTTGFAIDSASVGSNNIVVSWDGSTLPVAGADTDTILCVAVNAVNGNVSSAPLGVARSAETATIPMPEDTSAGNALHVYLAFRSNVTAAVSDSQHETQNAAS